MKHVKGVVFQIVLCILGVDDEKPPRVRLCAHWSSDGRGVVGVSWRKINNYNV